MLTADLLLDFTRRYQAERRIVLQTVPLAALRRELPPDGPAKLIFTAAQVAPYPAAFNYSGLTSRIEAHQLPLLLRADKISDFYYLYLKPCYQIKLLKERGYAGNKSFDAAWPVATPAVPCLHALTVPGHASRALR